jgi:hypothetical protein
MTIQILKKALAQMMQDLSFIKQHNLSLMVNKNAAVYNFKESREIQVQNSVRNSLKTIMTVVKGIDAEIAIKARMESLVKDMEFSFCKNKVDDFIAQADHLASYAAAIEEQMMSEQPRVKTIQRPRNLPADIMEEVNADIEELEKAYKAGCYRSSVILCGRIIEACLHRKVFEVTGNDYLEKNPGIGLGKVIALLKERNVEVDPALNQQIHLINQVRIFSVHTKQQPFRPTKEQAYGAGKEASQQGKAWPIKPFKTDLSGYDRIFVGSPVWFSMPAPEMTLMPASAASVAPMADSSPACASSIFASLKPI